MAVPVALAVFVVVEVLTSLVGYYLLVRFFPDAVARFLIRLNRNRSGLKEKHLIVAGFKMPYLEGGRQKNGDTPLLLLHGFAANKDHFTSVSRYLTPHFRILCPDLPGFGEASRDTAAKYGIADQVSRLREFLDQLKIDRVHLGGSSMGGAIAIQFAISFPEKVASLWLLGSAGAAASNESTMMKKLIVSGELPPLIARTPDDYQAVMAAVMTKPPYFPAPVLAVLARQAASDFELHRRIMLDLVQESTIDSLEVQLPAPALIVWGSEDQVLLPEGAKTLERIFRTRSTKLMNGIGHLPMMEAPKAAAKDYLEFRAKLRV